MLLITSIFLLIFTGGFGKHCQDKSPQGRPSECPLRKDLCDHPIYRKFMTEQCPRTCGRCEEVIAASGKCRDAVGPDGQTDCPKYPERCNDPVWHDLMHQQCPFTCGLCKKKTSRKGRKIFKAVTKPMPATAAPEYVDFPALVNSINPKYRECDDFFDYVCDGFRKDAALRALLDDKDAISAFKLVQIETQEKILDLFNKSELRQKNQRSPLFAKIYEYFDACVDEKGREGDRIVPTIFDELHALRRQFNGPSYTLNTEWIRAAAAKFPRDYLNTIQMDITQNALFFPIFAFWPLWTSTMRTGKYAGDQNVHLYELAFSRVYSGNALAGELNFMRAFLGQLFREAPQAAASLFPPNTPSLEQGIEQWLMEIRQVYEAIAQIYEEHDGTSAGSYQQETFRDIHANYLTGIDWALVLGDLDSRIKGDTKVLIKCQKCFRDMQTFIDQNRAQMQTFLEIDIIRRHIYALPPKFSRSFTPDYGHTQQLHCMERAASHFQRSFDRLFVANYFDDAKRADVMELIQRVKAEFRGMLVVEEEWMDAKTKAKALLKVDKMVAYSGYHDQIRDDAILATENQCYNQIEASRMSFGEIEMLATKCTLEKYIQQSTLVEDQQLLYHRPQYAQVFVANAFYSRTTNDFTILVGFLESPFYEKEMPEAMKMGAVGATIGHEITHGFDNIGRRYNEFGRIEDWWDPPTLEHFLAKEQCFIGQYGKFMVKVGEKEELPVNGELTLGENIADQGGIKTAYRALQTYLKTAKEENRKVVVRGLEYLTDEQLFFISYAFSWCSVEKGHMANTLITIDPHSPSKARVNVGLSNFQQFFDAFGCRKGDKMYVEPKERCQLW